MGELYLRKVEVEIIPQSGSSRTISDLRVQFECEKTNESSPNAAEISIFNLSETTRSLLEGTNTKVKVKIGYTGLKEGGFAGSGIGSTSNVELVCVGDVKKVTQEIASPDIITKIEVADGGNRFRNSRLEKGYPPNIKLDAVINELVETMGLNKGKVSIPNNKTYSNGLTLSGLVRDHLDTLTKANGLEWSIQNETIFITEKNKSTGEQVILLSPETGLIGSPAKTAEGVEFTSLIQPEIKPGRKISLQSRFINGEFKIRKVTHKGDSHQGDFLSECECTI